MLAVQLFLPSFTKEKSAVQHLDLNRKGCICRVR